MPLGRFFNKALSRLVLGFAILALLAAGPSWAFEDAALAEQAAAYRAELLQRYEGVDRAAINLRVAEQHVQQQRWQAAVESYQAAVANSPGSSALWSWLSRAWGGDPDRNNALNLDRAAQAAYSGYLASANDGAKALALSQGGTSVVRCVGAWGTRG